MFQLVIIDNSRLEPDVLYNFQDYTTDYMKFESVTKLIDLYFSLKQIDAMDLDSDDK